MQVVGLQAQPDPRGGAIVLTWTNPSDAAGIKILRRESTLPLVPQDFGTAFEIYDDPAARPGDSRTFMDTGAPAQRLRGGGTYYYAVVARDATANQFPVFVTSMATSVFQSGGYLYKNLPGVYQTFDTLLPPTGSSVDVHDQAKGQLLRFVEMFGLQLDLLRSFAAGVRTFHIVREVDGNLLQLLAQWIGWQSDFTQSFAKQRNEIAYAPSYFRTTGVPANLRAMVNRVSTWDARIKEFTHNIFRSTDPEQLALYTTKVTGTTVQPEQLVTLDVAHDGRPAVLKTSVGALIFYHARQIVPPGSENSGPYWHLWFKNHGQDGWYPSNALTSGGRVDRCPSALQRADGSIWLFWASYQAAARRLVPGLRLQVLSIGRGAKTARIQGTIAGPFALTDGDQFQVVITSNGKTATRIVTARAEDFASVGQATAQEVADLLDRELPFVTVTTTVEGFVVLETQQSGGAVSLQCAPSTIATRLGIGAPLTVVGADQLPATLTGALAEPFVLSSGDQLSILRDGDVVRVVTFESSSFTNIAAATAAEVAAAINTVIPGAAAAVAGRLALHSNTAGEPAFVSVDVGSSQSASKLGFGTPPPPLPEPKPERFALAPSQQLVLSGNADVVSTVVLQSSSFLNIAVASAAEVAAAINAAIPGAAQASGGQVLIAPFANLIFTNSRAAPKLGLDRSNPRQSSSEPFALSPGDQLVIQGNQEFTGVVTFNFNQFANIAAATAVEVVAAINSIWPGLASAQAVTVGISPLVGIDPTIGGAAATLGLGVPDESEPTVFEDASRNLWLFWSSRRAGAWNIWYSRFDGTLWGVPKQLTSGTLADREPSALFDVASSRIWVFWSRKKANGLWDIFYRTTTKLDFTTLTDGDWATAQEIGPIPPNPPANYDNREPAPVLLGADSLSLYFSSNRANGWNTWAKPISSTTQGVDTPITSGQFTRRAPAPLLTGTGEVTVWFRSNEPQLYTSNLYRSAQTVDARYSGSSTADTRNPARLSLRGNINDIQRYTYHSRSVDPSLAPDQLQVLEQKRLYSRDTVGVYLVPDTNDEQLILRNQARIADSLAKFLPIQVRAVFLVDQAFTELIYDYEGKGTAAPVIGEQMTDTIQAEALNAIADAHTDRANFKFVKNWASKIQSGGTPDLTVRPPDLSFRLPNVAVQEGA